MLTDLTASSWLIPLAGGNEVSAQFGDCIFRDDTTNLFITCHYVYDKKKGYKRLTVLRR